MTEKTSGGSAAEDEKYAQALKDYELAATTLLFWDAIKGEKISGRTLALRMMMLSHQMQEDALEILRGNDPFKYEEEK